MRGHAGSLSRAQPQPVLEALSRQERPFLPRLLLLYPESMQTTCTQTQPRCASRLGTEVRGLDSLAGGEEDPSPARGRHWQDAGQCSWMGSEGTRCAVRGPSTKTDGTEPPAGPQEMPATLRKEARAPAPPRGAAVGAGWDLQVTVFTTGCPGGSGASVGGQLGGMEPSLPETVLGRCAPSVLYTPEACCPHPQSLCLEAPHFSSSSLHPGPLLPSSDRPPRTLDREPPLFLGPGLLPHPGPPAFHGESSPPTKGAGVVVRRCSENQHHLYIV